MNNFYTNLENELHKLDEQHLFREMKIVHGALTEWVEIKEKKLLNLSSNNYLGIADHPMLKRAAIQAIQQSGCSATSARLIVGNYELYDQVERDLARFKNTEAALIFNSGYAANVGIVTALVGRGDIIISDKINHASIIDGARLSGAEFLRYKHKDMADLERCLQKAEGYSCKLIVTDSVFSMDGDLAPLPAIVELKEKYGAVLMIDEAHGSGVFGENGRGLADFYGVSDRVEINMGTLGKAFGCSGAYVAGRKVLIDYLSNKARSFIFTTGLPPAVVASVQAAIQVMQLENWRQKDVLAKASWVREELDKAGFNLLNSESQIIPILVGDIEATLEFSSRLFDVNILAVAIRPPTVPPKAARLRLSIMATHSSEDLAWAVEQIKLIGRELGII
ncbi:8-amino-7-oxononanoate synthase [Desulfosporosinus sp. BICA1-9]|uniref:8-amino-7-oxononanoate synthase n=1 Tax=Desulfosporosinus sp. BICA1-9 TaxID=1531958 RepID=UPI00054BE1EF|nr:8-amino-7-oxononanoate synthase [Desulfosporosinus sp. BICA1-9]KJS48290.1 MAG: 8-amino-7-oxononanoate synthase [Peptococcaceae bacterium BRH_c23]KJS90108.1 MAG: 8-amino-7-oxononanoate synthase [Desulfosporosinus sp. BICA1-9]